MRCLVRKSRIVSLSFMEAFEQRHLDMICGRNIICFIPSMPDVGADIAKELLSMRDALDNRCLRSLLAVEPFRQPIDLLDVEYSISLQKRDDILNSLARIAPRFLLELAGVNDKDALFTLAHVAAELLRLLVGHPHI